MSLVVAPCSFTAAKHAVLHWHYSQKMPSGRLVRYGVWENDRFIGAVLFGRGANDQLGKPYGLTQTESCELVRVALREHTAPVTQIVAAALRKLHTDSPGLRLVISFADPEQRHHGGIYQAGNWYYTGRSVEQRELLINGRFVHKRSANATYGTASVPALRALLNVPVEFAPPQWKHRYVMPLDKQTARRVARMKQEPPPPYDARAVEAPEVVRPAPGREVAGSIPVHRSSETLSA